MGRMCIANAETPANTSAARLVRAVSPRRNTLLGWQRTVADITEDERSQYGRRGARGSLLTGWGALK
jgi:hypothetical protein